MNIHDAAGICYRDAPTRTAGYGELPGDTDDASREDDRICAAIDRLDREGIKRVLAQMIDDGRGEDLRAWLRDQWSAGDDLGVYV